MSAVGVGAKQEQWTSSIYARPPTPRWGPLIGKQRVRAATRKVGRKTRKIQPVQPRINDAGTTRSAGLSQLLHEPGRASPLMT